MEPYGSSNKRVDPDGLDEFSVVFTERSVNHMSALFCRAMRDISASLKIAYSADAVALIPGGGTYGMESVARLFAADSNCIVLRNGWFSYRWSQIFDIGNIPKDYRVLKAEAMSEKEGAAFRPADLGEVLSQISDYRPKVLFAPHVETSSGILLPDEYIAAIGEKMRAIDGHLVLDCVASGAQWIDMQRLGVDVLITAPQKGWSSTPCASAVMLSAKALETASSRTSSSFVCDLNQWLGIMRKYEEGGYAYHATMPTDGLIQFRDAIFETQEFGLEHAREKQCQLGKAVRTLLEGHGFKSVAAQGFQSPSVVVSYTDRPDIRNGKLFVKAGVQVAGGVPLMCDEPADFSTFRIGLFGLDKLGDVEGSVARLERAVGDVLSAAI